MNEINQQALKAEIRLGRYRHFKGRHYQLIDIAHHSETQEALVVYRALYGDHSLWVRPMPMFFETIHRDGRNIQRFQYVGDDTR